RHTRSYGDWSSDVCSSDLVDGVDGLFSRVSPTWSCAFTRAGCHLCEGAKRVIDAARVRAEFDYEERDIDADSELLRLYNEEVPRSEERRVGKERRARRWRE